MAFPTISMSGVFEKIENQSEEVQPKRSTRIRKIKTFFDGPVVGKTSTAHKTVVVESPIVGDQSKKSKIKKETTTALHDKPVIKKSKTKPKLPRYIQYYENKRGMLVKIIRCKKCGGFLRKDQQECNRCILKAIRISRSSVNEDNSTSSLLVEKHTGGEKQTKVQVKKQVVLKNNERKLKQSIVRKAQKKKKNEGHSNTIALNKKYHDPVKKLLNPANKNALKSKTEKKASQIKSKDGTLSHNAQKNAAKSKVKSVSVQIKKPKRNLKENIVRKTQSKVKIMNAKSKARAVQTEKIAKNDQLSSSVCRKYSNAIYKKFKNADPYRPSASTSNHRMVSRQSLTMREELSESSARYLQLGNIDASTSTPDEKLKLLNYLSLKQQSIMDDMKKPDEKDESAANLFHVNDEDSTEVLLSGPNIEIVQENDEDQ